jgi:hypothetical protein
MMMIEAFGVVRAACKSKVAFDKATAILKGLRSQIEEIPRDTTATVDTNMQEGVVGRVEIAKISREPPPKSRKKGRTRGPEEEVQLGAKGKKLCIRECGWCHLRDGHYADTCPKNPTNFKKG